MLELPEAATLARQARETLVGRRIVSAAAGSSPHGFAFYSGDPATYGPRLAGQEIAGAESFAGYVELETDDWRLAFCDGARVRLCDAASPRPAKHQLLIELDDGRALVATVQMYAGILLLGEGGSDDPYYRAARHAPSPLEGAFTLAHLRGLAADARPASRSRLCSPQSSASRASATAASTTSSSPRASTPSARSPRSTTLTSPACTAPSSTCSPR